MPNASLLSIKKLNHKTFRIPAYQRGYRWTKRQIKDLVFDLWEFGRDKHSKIYCLQPIVLEKKNENGKEYYNVIDGQQRLTSLYLIGAVYRCLRHDDDPYDTHTDYTLEFADKAPFQEFLREVGACNSEDAIKDHLEQWKQTYKDIDSQNAISILSFLTQSDWRPAGKLKLIYEKLNAEEDDKDICIIWHELETDDDSEKAIETFANINANKIPLTDAELIKAVMLQAYGHEASDGKDGEPASAAAALNESTFANQWETVERGLNDSSFWCFFVKRIDAYKTRIDLLFEIWLKTENIPVSSDDHALYRAVLSTLKTRHVKDIWAGIVNIFETLQDWYREYYIYHMIGACSLLEKGDDNARFVCDLYTRYITQTKSDFRATLRDGLKKHYDDLMKDTDGIRSLSYDETKTETKLTLFLFNIALLLNAYTTCPDNTAERFPFDYYKEHAIEVEHINPRHPKKEASKPEVDAWRDEMRSVVEENGKQPLIDTNGGRTRITADMWETAAEVHSIGNLTLVDDKLNKGFSNGTFREKRNHVLSAMFGESVTTGEKTYPHSVLLPGARWVFLRQWRTDVSDTLQPELMTKDFWTKKEREFYVKTMENALHTMLAQATDNGEEEDA